MALHPDFPESPHAISDPAVRWFPADKELLTYGRRAIMQLAPKQREIFILRHWEGLSLKEIANTLGRSSGTVKAHLFHAHRNLRKLLRHYLQA